jgi:hypothetical protein
MYAPFKSFGGGFEGDARGPSTSEKATARVAMQIMFNTQLGLIGKPSAMSSESKWLPLGLRATGEPRASLSRALRIPDGFDLLLDIAGANPLVYKSADIDLHVAMKIVVKNRYFGVQAQLHGDSFPNAEMFVADQRGSARMLLTYETSSGPTLGPYVNLPGDRSRHMNSICLSWPVDSAGYFR